jgi:hypothetical protein
MNWNQIKSKCNKVSDRIKAAWNRLLGHDSVTTAGQSKLVPIPIGDRK